MVVKNIHEVQECPRCGSTNIVYLDDQDQVVCDDCGNVEEPLGAIDEE